MRLALFIISFFVFLLLLHSGTLEVFVELLRHIRVRGNSVTLAAVRLNLVGVQQLVRTGLVNVEEERRAAVIGNRQDDIGIRVIADILLEVLRSRAAVEGLDVDVLVSLDVLRNRIIRNDIAAGHAARIIDNLREHVLVRRLRVHLHIKRRANGQTVNRREIGAILYRDFVRIRKSDLRAEHYHANNEKHLENFLHKNISPCTYSCELSRIVIPIVHCLSEIRKKKSTTPLSSAIRPCYDKNKL